MPRKKRDADRVAEINADVLADVESGAFDEEHLQTAYEKAMAASEDAKKHPERLVRRSRPEGI